MPSMSVPLEPPNPNLPDPSPLGYRTHSERRMWEEIDRILETPAERDARLYEIWCNRDGTFTSEHDTIAQLLESALRCAFTCECWRHAVIREWRRLHD